MIMMVECYHLVFNASFKEQYCLCVNILYLQWNAMKMMGEWSCLLVYAPSAKANMILECLIVGCSKGEQRRLTDSKCYIFLKSSQQLWLSEKVIKYFKEVNIVKVWKEASTLYVWRLKVLYIFEILWAIVTQVKGFQSLSRRSTLPVLKGSFILISLKTPSVIYFQNPLSNCDSVRSLPSIISRITLPSLEISFILYLLGP